MDDAFSSPAAKSSLAPELVPPIKIVDSGPPALTVLDSTASQIAPNADWTVLIENDNAHVVQFYEANAYLLDAVAAYITTALQAGDAGIVIATKLHRDGLEQRLTKAGIDLDTARAEGHYVVHDALETLSTFMVDGSPDRDRFINTVGKIIETAIASHNRVRIFGGMVALLVADGRYDATLELERFWNDLQQELPFSLFCAYPMDHAGGEDLIDLFKAVNAAHTHVIPAESYSALQSSTDRLRAIADLQQRALWLEAEVANRIQVEERLRVALAAEQAARQEAEVAVRQRDEFLSIAAHELKTPLTSLSGQAQLALRRLRRSDKFDHDRIRQSIEVIAGQSNRLTILLNQLLDVSRLEAGKLSLDRIPTDVAALVASVVASIQPSTDAHSIRLSASSGLEARIDPLRIEQVVTNILDNAIKYSPAGGDILVSLAETEDDRIELSIRDHGIGISPEKQTKIFERFYQANVEDHTSGLGLGLFITRQIVELHGGQVKAEHPDGGGTRFLVYLPRGM